MALNLLAGEVSQFFQQCGGVMEEVDWDQKLQARTVGYDGAEVYTAECLDLRRICDALPPVGLGGLVNAADVSTGFVREALLDPSLVLKSTPLELDLSKDPMIWASDEDWQKLAVVLVDRNICELIEFDERAEVNGRKVLGGLMGVAKVGNDRNTRPQRLSTSGQWQCLFLEDEETLVSGEDLKCCFHVFEIPKRWRRWMTFAKLVNRECFFPGRPGQVYLCSKVLPMGWVSATGVIQDVHQRLLTSPLQPLRCLEPAAEIRRDRPLPDESSRTTGSLGVVCPTRGKVSTAGLSPGDLYVGRGSADSVWASSIWDNPFRVSEVGSAARAVKLYGVWLVTQKDLLRQLPRLDGKRLLCHCHKSSPCHVDALTSTWRSHRSPLSSRLRSMWQVYIDNLDVLVVCD